MDDQIKDTEQSENMEKAKLTIFYELPKLNEKIADNQAASVSVDVSFSVQFRPALV